MCKTSEKDTSKYRGSIYVLSMVIHCPNYAHRIPNVSPGLVFGGGLMFGRISDLVYRGTYSGGLIFGILRNLNTHPNIYTLYNVSNWK